MRILLTTIMAVLPVLASGCVANSICAKRQECNDKLEDDSEAVCVQAHHRLIDTLRANDEESCHRLADAFLARDACAAQLDCDDFEEDDLGEKCEDEQDDLEDALEDAITRGESECDASE